MIYLDHNATTPIDGRVLDAMLPYLKDAYGNPSSAHRVGRTARAAIDQAREQVAELVNAHPSQVIFTSGGTEANNLALKGVMAGLVGGTLVHSAIEHASVLGPAQSLERHGVSRRVLPVNSDGRVDPEGLDAVMDDDVRLVSVMLANNETGVLQDVAAVAEQLQGTDAVLHTDAVQAAGKMAVDFRALGVQLMTLSAHKIYGPKGAGALVVDKALELAPLLDGGGHERGLRAGTENVAGIVGFGMAAELARCELNADAERLTGLRTDLERRLDGLPQVTVFGTGAPRLPNTVQLAVAGIDGPALLLRLDAQGVAVSSGSACATGATEPSHVLLAMGVEPGLARGAIRVSLGRQTQREHIDRFCTALQEQIEQLTARSGAAAIWG